MCGRLTRVEDHLKGLLEGTLVGKRIGGLLAGRRHQQSAVRVCISICKGFNIESYSTALSAMNRVPPCPNHIYITAPMVLMMVSGSSAPLVP